MSLQRIILSAGLFALTGVGLFPSSVALAQTNRHPQSRKSTPQRKLSARQIAQRTSPSVVLLVTADEGDNPIALGSGFFVQSNVIATAFHVVRDAPQIYAKIAGRQARHKISFIGSSDEKNDLALLRIDDVKGQPLKLGNPLRLRVGDEIYVMGNPEGLEGTFSRGNISAMRNSEGLIQITAPISHGSSGGPVLDERGEVIGVATGVLTEGQNLNFAVPVSKLDALLKDYRNPYLIRKPVQQEVDPLSAIIEATPIAEWQFVASSPAEDFYVSQARITRTPEHTSLCWTKVVPEETVVGRASRDRYSEMLRNDNVNRSYAFNYRMEQSEFDCGHRRGRRLWLGFYDRDGVLLHSQDLSARSEWEPALPNSVYEAELNFVCKGRQ